MSEFSTELDADGIDEVLVGLCDPVRPPDPDTPVRIARSVSDKNMIEFRFVVFAPPTPGTWRHDQRATTKHQVGMVELLEIVATVTSAGGSRDEASAALLDRMRHVLEHHRARVRADLEQEWRQRPQWTAEQAADHCGVNSSTWRSYVARQGAPEPVPWWGRGRDATGNLFDTKAVRAWQAQRPGQGSRSDLAQT